MARQLGSRAQLSISADGITYTDILRVKKADFTPETTAVDSTDNDDNGFKSALYGDQMRKITGTCNYDPNDPGQQLLVNASLTKQKYYLRYRSRGFGTNLPTASGIAVITKAYAPSEHEKIQELAFDAQSDGPWTDGFQ